MRGIAWAVNAVAYCATFGAVVLLARRRAKARLKARFSSVAAFGRFKRACESSGRSLLLVSDDLTKVDLTWTSSRRAKFTPTRAWNRLCGIRILEDKRLMGEVLNGQG